MSHSIAPIDPRDRRRIDPRLRFAVLKGIVAVVENFVTDRSHLEAIDENGDGLLVLSVANNQIAIFRLLCEAGAVSVTPTAQIEKAARILIELGEIQLINKHLESKTICNVPDVVEVEENEMAIWQPETIPARTKQNEELIKFSNKNFFEETLTQIDSDLPEWGMENIVFPTTKKEEIELLPNFLSSRTLGKIKEQLQEAVRYGYISRSEFIDVAVSHYPRHQRPLIKSAFACALAEAGAQVFATPRLRTYETDPESSVTEEEKELIDELLNRIDAHLLDAVEGDQTYRNQIRQLSILQPEDEFVYGKLIRTGLENVFALVSRCETALTFIQESVRGVSENEVPAANVFNTPSSIDKAIEAPEESAEIIEDENDAEDEEKSEENLPIEKFGDFNSSVIIFNNRLEALFYEAKSQRPIYSNSKLCREIANLLSTQSFAITFLEALGELNSQIDIEKKIIIEIRDELKKIKHSRNSLFMSNMKLVFWWAKKYQNRGLDLDDLVQEGALGLLKSVERFDPFLGYRFSTYSSWWIRQNISRAIADTGSLVRLPVHVFEKYSKLKKLRRNGMIVEQIDLVTLAEALKSSHKLTKFLLDYNLEFSALNEINLEEALRYKEAAKDPFEGVLEKQLERAVESLVSELSDRDRKVISLRFGIGVENGVEHTLEEIGQMYGLTRERIRQLELRILTAFRQPSKARGLKGKFR